LVDVTVMQGATCMIMPKMICNLTKAITTNMLNNKQKLNIAHKLIIAVAFLHTNNVIHRDIKTDNILLDDKMDPVLADFSLAKLFDHKLSGTTHTPGLGTASYKAPEVYKETGYGLAADVFGLGVVLLELFNGMMKVDRDKAALKYLEDVRQKLSDRPVPSLLKSMLHPDPDSRITCRAALMEPAFGKLDPPEIPQVVSKVLRVDGPPVVVPKKTQRGGKQRVPVKSAPNHVDVLFELLEYTNPLTKVASGVYLERSGEPLEYCIVLAGKMYEEELLSMAVIRDYIEDFDIEEYAESEMIIFRHMNFCLFV